MAVGANVVAVTRRSWGGSETLVASDTAEEFRSDGRAALRVAICRATARAGARKLSEVMRLQWADMAREADIIIQATSSGM